MSAFKVIDMPLPSKAAGYSKSAKSDFAKMLLGLKPGQAFVLELDPSLPAADKARQHSRLSARLQGVTRTYGVKFCTRRIEQGIGVWKVEKEEA